MLALFAFASGWVVQHHLDQERFNNEQVAIERLAAWGDLLKHSLPPPDAPPEEQSAAIREWSTRLRTPLALDDVGGVRIGASDSFVRRTAEGVLRPLALHLDDGRTLWTMRAGVRLDGAAPRAQIVATRGGGLAADPPFLLLPPGVPRGLGVAGILLVLFLAVAAGAYPVVRHLTRRLETLKRGVDQFGAGALHHRVAVSGRDEVAAVASSFNVAAARIETLVQSHRSLLANASHELRSPLARMKMAVSMLDSASPEQRDRLKREIDTNVKELDALVEEVLLASRLDATEEPLHRDKVDLPALAAEEAARVEATVDAPAELPVGGDERLLRRALRNLLENARRYGGGEVGVVLSGAGAESRRVLIQVCDRGPGVPPELRERIFEPFFRMPGHAEQAGGVGLGLALVKQIASRHGGSARCEARTGGGSCFTIELPRAA